MEQGLEGNTPRRSMNRETEVQDLDGTDEGEMDSLGESEIEETETEETDDEQPEGQDDESEETEEVPEEQDDDLKEGDGKFNWKNIGAKLGKVGTELERSFSEAQKTTNKALREKSELESRVRDSEGFKQEAQMFRQFDNLVRSNPEVRAAVEKALGVAQQAPLNIPGVDPNDPVVPLIMRQQQTLQQLQNLHLERERREQQQQRVNEFRQGLLGAKDRFKDLIGRDPSREELEKVASVMRDRGFLDGESLVPSLFLEEIRKSERDKLAGSREKKKNLPKSPKTGVRQSGTSKGSSLSEAFDAAWNEHGAG
jgi:hypothetical protein